MALPKIHSLTETDVRVLLSLVRPQTVDEMHVSTGISYNYLRNRITKLKNRNYIKTIDRKGQAYIYQTLRLPETEMLFDLQETASSTNGNIYKIADFYGQHLSFNEAFQYVNEKKSKLRDRNAKLFEIIVYAISIIKVRSYRKHTGEIAVQHPHEQEMRQILGEYIDQTKRELRLAEELYNTKFLWSGHENIWEIISEGPPSDSATSFYNKANEVLR